jgi:ribosomal protein S18 acetylase RimI-like enzyme
MIHLRPIDPTCTTAFRGTRLRALQDSPFAFGSTYEKELLLSDADWERRALQWNGDRSTARLAWDNDQVCGLVAGFVDAENQSKAHVVSMWVAPTHRKRGVGRLLIRCVMDWAKTVRAQTVHLMVTSNNDAAINFYKHLGFKMTGRVEPYPNDQAVVEFEMVTTVA